MTGRLNRKKKKKEFQFLRGFWLLEEKQSGSLTRQPAATADCATHHGDDMKSVRKMSSPEADEVCWPIRASSSSLYFFLWCGWINKLNPERAQKRWFKGCRFKQGRHRAGPDQRTYWWAAGSYHLSPWTGSPPWSPGPRNCPSSCSCWWRQRGERIVLLPGLSSHRQQRWSGPGSVLRNRMTVACVSWIAPDPVNLYFPRQTPKYTKGDRR